MSKRIPKYNPAFLTGDELVEAFVVRHAELELIVQVVRDNVSGSKQHVLVIGPRGIGKTMLVLRAAEEIRRDEDLRQRWYPLVFSEESYPVTSPGEFWLEAIFHIGQQTKDERWKKTFEELRGEQDEGRLRERALAQVMDFADEIGRRILLIVENFNMLVGDQISDDDAWVLRHTLLNEGRVMLLATATNRFEQIENAGKAMFELFRTEELGPLDRDECRELWTSLTGEEMTNERIRPIEILTGGSPRLMRIVSEFASKMSFRELMDDLMHLVDDHTEYFKSHLEYLPATERKVYLALAEIWDPATAREVGEAARLSVSKTSSLLRRLMERGAVVLADGKGRKKEYQVAERMYNIYYLMRRRGAPSRRVRGVVNFMVGFYGREELMRVAERIAGEACQLDSGLRRDHYFAYGGIMEKMSEWGLRDKLVEVTPKDFFDMPDMPASLKLLIGREEAGEAEGDEELRAMLERAERLAKDPCTFGEAEEAYRKAIELDEKFAWAWRRLGLFLHEKLERYDEAEEAYHKAIELDEKSAWAWVGLGWLLHDKLERYDEAEEAYRKAIELDGKSAAAWAGLGLLLDEKLERYEEAEEAYRKVIELDEKAAWPWARLGQLLDEKLERYDEAEEAYRKAIEFDEKFVAAWGNLGMLLHEKLGGYDEAETAYRKVIELDEKDGLAWRQLGQLLAEKLERYDEAEEAYRKAIELEPSVPWVYVKVGQLLHDKLERYDEAEEAYRKAIELDEKAGGAWARLGLLLYEKLERYEEAEETYRKAIALDEKYAGAWAGLGLLLDDKLERYDEAEEAYRKAIELEPEGWLGLQELIILLLTKLDRASEAAELAQERISKEKGNAEIRNSIGWGFCEHAPLELLPRAEQWAREAIELEPEEGYYRHTLASILCRLGKVREALEQGRKYLEDVGLVEKTVNDAIDLFVGLAARGAAKEALEILRGSASAEVLEPLIVGLRIYVGEDVKAAAEIMEIGKDVVKRIEERGEEMEGDKSRD